MTNIKSVSLFLPHCSLSLFVCLTVALFVCSCAFRPVLYVLVCEGEVRGLRGDDMHVSRHLTSLRILRLVGCPPPSHDGHSGNWPFSFIAVCFLWWFSGLKSVLMCFVHFSYCDVLIRY